MTPSRIISIVRQRLPKRFHEEVIRQSISMAYDVFIALERDLSPYRKDYDSQAVVEASGRSYTLLPDSCVNIDDAVKVLTITGKNFVFEEVDQGEFQLLEELEVSKISDVIKFVRRPDKIIYQNIPSGITTVSLQVVIPFEKIGDQEYFHLPKGADELIIDQVTENLLGVQPTTDINDGTEITL